MVKIEELQKETKPVYIIDDPIRTRREGIKLRLKKVGRKRLRREEYARIYHNMKHLSLEELRVLDKAQDKAEGIKDKPNKSRRQLIKARIGKVGRSNLLIVDYERLEKYYNTLSREDKLYLLKKIDEDSIMKHTKKIF